MLIVILCYFYICCVTAAIFQEKTTNLKERDFFIIPEDDSIKTDSIKTYLKQEEQDINMKKSVNNNKASLEDADVKINETDLYENGQEAKKKNERSFIIINQKFKSQRLKSRPTQKKSFFDDDDSAPDFDAFPLKKHIINAEDIIQSTHKNEFAYQGAQKHKEHKITEKGAQCHNEYKTGTSYFRQIPEAVARAHNESEYAELHKRTLVRPFSIASNDRAPISRPVQEFFRSRDDRLDTNSLFHLMDSDDAMQKSTLGDDDLNSIPLESIEDDVKFDQHLNALRYVTSSDKGENYYNCYSSKCKAELDKHNNVVNNGVKVGLRCLCVEAVLRDRTEATKNNATPTAGYTTELTESEEAVVKETSKLMKMGDQNESAK